jgi:hypothetical protein
MNVSSVGSSPHAQALQQSVQAPKAGGDSDGDSDGSGAKVAQSAQAATVNLSGQKIGQIISTSA